MHQLRHTHEKISSQKFAAEMRFMLAIQFETSFPHYAVWLQINEIGLVRVEAAEHVVRDVIVWLLQKVQHNETNVPITIRFLVNFFFVHFFPNHDFVD